MLGYVRAYKPELKVKDYEIYRGIYCSLCRALGRNYSPLAQLFLSYDFTLAALLRLACAENGCEFTGKRCPYNPSKKCLNCSEKEVFDLCAHAVIIIVYYKIIDNLSDGGFLRKLGAALLFPIVSLMHRKAKKRFPECEKIVSESIAAQSAAEKKDGVSIDEAAHSSADALGKIFSSGFEGAGSEKLYRFGYMIGRYVYILDAVDDLEDDIKTGSFNPFIKEYPDISSQEKKAEFAQRAERMLNVTQNAALEAFDELEIKRFSEIIDNIALEGITAGAETVLARYNGKNVKAKSFTVK